MVEIRGHLGTLVQEKRIGTSGGNEEKTAQEHLPTGGRGKPFAIRVVNG